MSKITDILLPSFEALIDALDIPLVDKLPLIAAREHFLKFIAYIETLPTTKQAQLLDQVIAWRDQWWSMNMSNPVECTCDDLTIRRNRGCVCEAAVEYVEYSVDDEE